MTQDLIRQLNETGNWWMIGKGRTRRTEPLMGCVLEEPRIDGRTLARAEGEDRSVKDIAEMLGISVKTVYALAASGHGRAGRGQRRARPCEGGLRTVTVPIDVLARLAPHATRRGITSNELIRRMLDIIVDDDLMDGILDDAEVVP